MFKKLGRKAKALGVVAGATLITSSAQAALDTTAAATQVTDGIGIVETFAITVIGAAIALKVIDWIQSKIKRA